MTIKILGGLLKGYALKVPKGDITRPTSVLLRRRIFDSRQDLSDWQFIDLCAGTGAMGLEAISRRATYTLFLENAPSVLKVLKDNVQKIPRERLDQGQRWEVKKQDCLTWIKKCDPHFYQNSQCIFYFDPPYENHNLYWNCFAEFFQLGYEGELWVESDEQKGVGLSQISAKGYVPYKVFQQGTSFLALFSSNSSDQEMTDSY